MSFSLPSLLSSFIFSVFGFYIAREGKKRDNVSMIVVGVILMFYTYFTPNPWWDWGLGSSLMYLAYYLR